MRGPFLSGPRNPLPEGYHPPVLADKSTINRCLWLSTRETAGAGVDQMMIILPLQAYSFLQIEYLRILVYHGHIFGSQETEAQAQRIKLQFFCRYTHIPLLEKRDEIIYLNPGSPFLPKENWEPTAAFLENGIVGLLNIITVNCLKEVSY